MFDDSGFGGNSNNGGYNIHADFNNKQPHQVESNHYLLKFLIFIGGVIAIGIFANAVNSYGQHQAQKAEEARQEFAAEVEAMDLSPYCKNNITKLSVTKTDFERTDGSGSDNSLFHLNTITIEGSGEWTERMSHQDVWNIMNTTLTNVYADVEAMCDDSAYGSHVKMGHAMYKKDRVYHYRNCINVYLSDSKSQYSVNMFYPPEKAKNKFFFVKTVSGVSKGEQWTYRVTDKNGDSIFELYTYRESDAERAEQSRKNKPSYEGTSGTGAGGAGYSRGSSDRGSKETTKGNSGTYKKRDMYNSRRYKDADRFAEDYYEEFYDYEDYEDDDDAYDGAVDYWEEMNE